jgi:hypothetical protein
MTATAQAQAEVTKEAQRACIGVRAVFATCKKARAAELELRRITPGLLG